MNQLDTLKCVDTNSPVLDSVSWIHSVVIPVLQPLVTGYGIFSFCDFQWVLYVVCFLTKIIPLI